MRIAFARAAAFTAATMLLSVSSALADVRPEAAVPASYGGFVDASGNIAAGSGFTVAHTGTGTYTVTYPDSKFPAGFPAVTVTPWGYTSGSVPVAFVSYLYCTAKKSCIFIVNTAITTGTAADNGFMFNIIQAK